MLKYIEQCTGANHNGPAWIGFACASRSGQTVYFNGKAFKRASSGRGSGNHYDLETGDPYWISGVKKRGEDRHWAGSGTIAIEAAAVEEYLRVTGQSELNSKRYTVTHDIEPPDPSKFCALENESAES